MPSADWNDLEVFAAVAQRGSLAAAGRALRMDSSTVSRRVQRLEDRLGVTLFQRSPGGMLLSESGRRLQGRVTKAAELIALGIDEATRGPGEVAGTVRIAASTDIGSGLLMPILGVLQREHAGLVLEYVLGSAVVDLEQREADIAVRGMPPTSGDLRRARLVTVDFEVFAAPELLERAGHRDLACLPWIDWPTEPGAVNSSLLYSLLPDAVVVARADQVVAVRAACRLGHGLALLPDVFGRIDGLVPLPTPWQAPEISLWLVAGAASLERPAVRAVWDRLMQTVAKKSVEERLTVLRSYGVGPG